MQNVCRALIKKKLKNLLISGEAKFGKLKVYQDTSYFFVLFCFLGVFLFFSLPAVLRVCKIDTYDVQKQEKYHHL